MQKEQLIQVNGEGSCAHFPKSLTEDLETWRGRLLAGRKGYGGDEGGEFPPDSWPPRQPLRGHLEDVEEDYARPGCFNAGKWLGCRNLERFPKRLPQSQVLLALTRSDGTHVLAPAYHDTDDPNMWS